MDLQYKSLSAIRLESLRDAFLVVLDFDGFNQPLNAFLQSCLIAKAMIFGVDEPYLTEMIKYKLSGKARSLMEGKSFTTINALSYYLESLYVTTPQKEAGQIFKRSFTDFVKPKATQNNVCPALKYVQKPLENCQLCDKPGHTSVSCNFYKYRILCQLCQNQGHSARVCHRLKLTANSLVKCQLCDKNGHSSLACNFYKLQIACQLCRIQGHSAKVCSNFRNPNSTVSHTQSKLNQQTLKLTSSSEQTFEFTKSTEHPVGLSKPFKRSSFSKTDNSSNLNDQTLKSFTRSSLSKTDNLSNLNDQTLKSFTRSSLSKTDNLRNSNDQTLNAHTKGSIPKIDNLSNSNRQTSKSFQQSSFLESNNSPNINNEPTKLSEFSKSLNHEITNSQNQSFAYSDVKENILKLSRFCKELSNSYHERFELINSNCKIYKSLEYYSENIDYPSSCKENIYSSNFIEETVELTNLIEQIVKPSNLSDQTLESPNLTNQTLDILTSDKQIHEPLISNKDMYQISSLFSENNGLSNTVNETFEPPDSLKQNNDFSTTRSQNLESSNRHGSSKTNLDALNSSKLNLEFLNSLDPTQRLFGRFNSANLRIHNEKQSNSPKPYIKITKFTTLLISSPKTLLPATFFIKPGPEPCFKFRKKSMNLLFYSDLRMCNLLKRSLISDTLLNYVLNLKLRNHNKPVRALFPKAEIIRLKPRTFNLGSKIVPSRLHFHHVVKPYNSAIKIEFQCPIPLVTTMIDMDFAYENCKQPRFAQLDDINGPATEHFKSNVLTTNPFILDEITSFQTSSKRTFAFYLKKQKFIKNDHFLSKIKVFQLLTFKVGDQIKHAIRLNLTGQYIQLAQFIKCLYNLIISYQAKSNFHFHNQGSYVAIVLNDNDILILSAFHDFCKEFFELKYVETQNHICKTSVTDIANYLCSIVIRLLLSNSLANSEYGTYVRAFSEKPNSNSGNLWFNKEVPRIAKNIIEIIILIFNSFVNLTQIKIKYIYGFFAVQLVYFKFETFKIIHNIIFTTAKEISVNNLVIIALIDFMSPNYTTKFQSPAKTLFLSLKTSLYDKGRTEISSIASRPVTSWTKPMGDKISTFSFGTFSPQSSHTTWNLIHDETAVSRTVYDKLLDECMVVTHTKRVTNTIALGYVLFVMHQWSRYYLSVVSSLTIHLITVSWPKSAYKLADNCAMETSNSELKLCNPAGPNTSRSPIHAAFRLQVQARHTTISSQSENRRQ